MQLQGRPRPGQATASCPGMRWRPRRAAYGTTSFGVLHQTQEARCHLGQEPGPRWGTGHAPGGCENKSPDRDRWVPGVPLHRHQGGGCLKRGRGGGGWVRALASSTRPREPLRRGGDGLLCPWGPRVGPWPVGPSPQPQTRWGPEQPQRPARLGRWKGLSPKTGGGRAGRGARRRRRGLRGRSRVRASIATCWADTCAAAATAGSGSLCSCPRSAKRSQLRRGAQEGRVPGPPALHPPLPSTPP